MFYSSYYYDINFTMHIALRQAVPTNHQNKLFILIQFVLPTIVLDLDLD